MISPALFILWFAFSIFPHLLITPPSGISTAKKQPVNSVCLVCMVLFLFLKMLNHGNDQGSPYIKTFSQVPKSLSLRTIATMHHFVLWIINDSLISVLWSLLAVKQWAIQSWNPTESALLDFPKRKRCPQNYAPKRFIVGYACERQRGDEVEMVEENLRLSYKRVLANLMEISKAEINW